LTFDFQREMVALVPQLRAFARMMAGDMDRADDLVQDAVARALKARDQFEPGSNLRAWLFTILRNQYINQFRRRRVTEPMTDPEYEWAGSQGGQDTRVEWLEARRALDVLSAEHREVLMLVAIGGFSYEAASAVCGCPVGTIKSRLSRARTELRRQLEAGSGRTAARMPAAVEERRAA
jgi:RNA polymerase sigma-70 factor (ECF subfamily)